MPDVAEAWGVRPPVGPWVWGCPASEGRAAVVSVESSSGAVVVTKDVSQYVYDLFTKEIGCVSAIQ